MVNIAKKKLSAGVYNLHCVRVKEYISDVMNGHVLKSAVCEHTADKLNHYIRFYKPYILVKENRYSSRLYPEVIEI